MANTVWNLGDPYHYVEIITKGYAVARGGDVKKFFNIFHFRRTTTVNVLVKANIEGEFNLTVGAAMLAALNVDYTQTAISVRFFENPLDAEEAISETGVGAIGGDRGPDFQAVTIQLKTGVRGKPYRGSKHFGPVAESDTTGDCLVAGAVTRYNAIGGAITTGFTDSDGNIWVPGLKGGTRPGSPAQYLTVPTTTVWTDITTWLLNKSLGTMRRRRVSTVN